LRYGTSEIAMPESHKQTENFMRQALALAERGIGLASPNPCVGALLVSEAGEPLGSGFYTYDGLKHAEILALDDAAKNGKSAKGSTLYINLEPCCHHGRTGPCADALIAAGIRRIVAAMPDPNPLVFGKGFEKLRAAGIEVIEGVLRAEAEKRNESFAKYIREHIPLVTLKAAMTLDGKIAPPPGESHNPTALGAGGATGGWITSDVARAHVQELRHASDAIMVGVGTIIADDPLLTDRTGLPRRRPLLRAIMDSRLRLPLESRVVKTAANDVIVLCAFAEEKKKRALEARGVRVQQVALGASPAATAEDSPKVRRMPVRRRTGTGKPIVNTASLLEGRPDLHKVMQCLGELEITSLLIEGGALVNWTALSARVVDKVFLYYAPKILGGAGSVPFATGPGFHLTNAAYVRKVSIHHFGEDFAVEGYLRDPYGRGFTSN
jgi:diaminohydroxyphosphoribosylaminopyrimidine deaminase/5-amino-6-(5-phosphoribosylamino)uracil reductase